MPSFVNPEKCDGCKALDKTACQYICPNDLMVLNADTMKAYNREPDMCWECYNCVKICPTQAVDVRGYADFVPMGASVFFKGFFLLFGRIKTRQHTHFNWKTSKAVFKVIVVLLSK